MHPPRKHEARSALAALSALLALGTAPVAAQYPPGPWPGYPPGYWAPPCVTWMVDVAENIESCMRAAMYPEEIGWDGEQAMSAEAAALLCRGAHTDEASESLARCARSVLYEHSGLGERREGVPAEAATLACRYATSDAAVDIVEDCMERLLYERSGLGGRREDLSPLAAASACQGTVAPVLPPYPYAPYCQPPTGSVASELLEDCVRRLMYEREGLGRRREEMSAEAAVLACQGALSPYP